MSLLLCNQVQAKIRGKHCNGAGCWRCCHFLHSGHDWPWMSLLCPPLSSLSDVTVKQRNRGADASRGEASRSRSRSNSGSLVMEVGAADWGAYRVSFLTSRCAGVASNPPLKVNQTLPPDGAQRNAIKPPSCIHSLQDFCSVNMDAHLWRARGCLTVSCQLSEHECKYYRLFTFTCGLLLFISCKCHWDLL